MEKMNIEAFAEKMRELVQDATLLWDKVCDVQLHQVDKNNGVILHGLTIMSEESNVAPTIYVEGEYQEYLDGKNLDECTSSLIKIYKEHQGPEHFAVDFFQDFEQAKGLLAMKLINLKQNQTMLENSPHYTYGDLAVVFQVMLQNDAFGSASITVKNQHMEYWNVTPAVLFENAKNNMDEKQSFLVQSMVEVMREMMQGDFPEEMSESAELPMYVVSNEAKMNGAAAMICLDKMQEFAEKVNSNVFVIPSSIHELILIPANDEMDADRLTEMVREVNETQVSPEEVLSDHVYFYDKEEKLLMIAETKEPMILKEASRKEVEKGSLKKEEGEKKPIKERLEAGKEKVSKRDAEPKEHRTQTKERDLQMQ